MPPIRTIRPSSFRLRRPGVDMSVLDRRPDDFISQTLTELDRVLGRRVWRGDREIRVADVDVDGDGDADLVVAADMVADELRDGLDRRLAAKRPTMQGQPWPEGTLLDVLSNQQEGAALKSLDQIIAQDPRLSTLRYEFLEDLATHWDDLDYNRRAILSDDNSNLRDYLIARARYVDGARNLIGLKSRIHGGEDSGLLADVEDYVVLTAARLLVDERQINVDRVNRDDAPLAREVLASTISFADGTFEAQVNRHIDDIVFNGDHIRLIRDTLGALPTPLEAKLLTAMRTFAIPIDDGNAERYLPSLLTHIAGASLLDEDTAGTIAPDAAAFDVVFLNEGTGIIPVNTESVRAAAQLYYCMVLGDELEVFDSVNYLTHKLLLEESVPLEDQRLRRDLQDYVFSNRFRINRDGRTELIDRSRPAERQMFYRQVFGNSAVGDRQQAETGTGHNQDFARMWKVLVLESRSYLERASLSPTAGTYVSPQPIQQAVEDLQYNLSTHSTGMATVLTPLVYEELTFVTRRILQHPEILRWLAPQGGTWWRVIERIHLAMKGRRPRATVLNDKAEYGYSILRAIADYHPAAFTDDDALSKFLSNIDAFIISQSILQSPVDRRDEPDVAPDLGTSPLDAMANGRGDGTGQVPAGSFVGTDGAVDEWDF